MREVELVPDARNLMESTRSIGYSLAAAVADIIDNSIAAEADKVEVWTPEGNDSFFAILDNGFGMNEEALQVAMRYGSRYWDEERKNTDLGRFGLGLKMASLSQCRCLTVLSKTKDGKICGARWDLDHVAESAKQWSLQMLDPDDLLDVPWYSRLTEMQSGTLVLWQKLDVLFLGIKQRGLSHVMTRKLSELKNHLSLVFHRYLEGEDGRTLEILFNNASLKPCDPFLVHRSQRPFAADPYYLGGERITVEPFILPHPNLLSEEDKKSVGDLQKFQGFYIYRNRRLVIWGTWFRLCQKLNLSKLARVKVDIPASAAMDRMWSLDVKKANAIIPEELKDILKKVVLKLSERSGKVWTCRARLEMSKDAVWLRKRTAEGTVSYTINMENPVIRHFIENNKEVSGLIKLISARLPLDSLYSDLDDDLTIDTGSDDFEEFMSAMEEEGVDVSSLRSLRS